MLPFRSCELRTCSDIFNIPWLLLRSNGSVAGLPAVAATHAVLCDIECLLGNFGSAQIRYSAPGTTNKISSKENLSRNFTLYLGHADLPQTRATRCTESSRTCPNRLLKSNSLSRRKHDIHPEIRRVKAVGGKQTL